MEPKNIELTKENIQLLNTKFGLRALIYKKDLKLDKALRWAKYETEMVKVQEKLIELQTAIITQKKKMAIIFEGRDMAGKTGAIRRITARMNPRFYNVIALPKPSSDEKTQWYFQRYVKTLPQARHITFFDRSWYNRAVMEPVNGFCTKQEYDTFMLQVNDFEEMISQSGIILIKLYFSITKEEQKKRLERTSRNLAKKWKITDLDIKAPKLWDKYTEYKKIMFEKTNTALNPWKIIEANRKTEARIKAIEYVLEYANKKIEKKS